MNYTMNHRSLDSNRIDVFKNIFGQNNWKSGTTQMIIPNGMTSDGKQKNINHHMKS